MEKIKGKFIGSCWECGHGYLVDVNGEPFVTCVPASDLFDKYEKGCAYLVPRCEHNETTQEEHAAKKSKVTAGVK